MPTTAYGSILVSNLRTTAKYVDHFALEVYTDAGLTNKVAVSLVKVKWDGTYNAQVEPCVFRGLTMGTTYYVRAGVVPPLKAQTTWSSGFACIAGGTVGTPTTTYTITSKTSTIFGMEYVITPNSPPSDLNHYEVIFTRNDTNVPASTATPMLDNLHTVSGTLTMFLPAKPSDTVRVYIRTVNTAGKRQAWTVASTDATNANTLDNIGDGTSFIRIAQFGTGISVDNGNFEASNTLPPPSWEANNGAVTLSYETSTQQSGNRSLKIVTTVQYTGVLQVKKWRIAPGDSYKVSGYIKTLSGATGYIFFAFLDANGNWLDGVQAISNSSTWATAVGVSTAPVGSVYGIVGCHMMDVNGGTGWFDNISCIRVVGLDDEVADGTTYGRVLGTALTNGGINPARPGFLARGSIPPSLSGAFGYTNTTTTITMVLSSYRIYQADGTYFDLTASQQITGLTAGTTYGVYLYYDEIAASLGAVAGDRGSPAWLHSSVVPTQAKVALLVQKDHIPLSQSVVSVATTTSGSGGGSGGGGGGCLREDMVVRVLREQAEMIIPCREVMVGDKLHSPHGWLAVTGAEILPHDIWVSIRFSNGEVLVVTNKHPFTLYDSAPKRAEEMTLLDAVPTVTGIAYPEEINLLREPGRKVSITCDDPHVFYAGKISPTVLTHNVIFYTQ